MATATTTESTATAIPRFSFIDKNIPSSELSTIKVIRLLCAFFKVNRFTEGIWISTVGFSVVWVLVKLVVTVLQWDSLGCLVNPTVRSSLLEL
ncbi:hypothetical protein F2Q69_00001430 [Brassica cretica]|uniref:Uncharacterized protein n=1 Tax=Brassica cretica TaxID=69181 RepID=A0A8S9PB53_BRACR|nr:hypothetical protein F2Q69_00001430 [Brassica cretica]